MTKLDAADMARRSAAVRDFHEEATGLKHIAITIMSHQDYVTPPKEDRDRIAQSLVDAAQARSKGGTSVIKGRLADDTNTHFVVLLIAVTRTAIVYLSHDGGDAQKLCDEYKAEMLRQEVGR